MDRRLILMRHAKSSWKTDATSDHERPLNKRGRRDAPRVAEVLATLGWEPELVVSSTATRTRETWQLMAPAFDEGGELPVWWEDDLYHGGLAELRASADEWPDDVETVLTLGHNPGWEHAMHYLSGVQAVMTTGNAALLEGRGDTWAEALADGARWEVIDLVRPREVNEV